MPVLHSHPNIADHALPELSLVSLTRAVEAEAKTLPARARGTIVGRYSDGHGYEVEVLRPFHAVVTLACDDIAE